MELKLIKQHEKYLGHPSLKGKSQKQTYSEIKQSFYKDSRLESEVLVQSWQRETHQSGGKSDSYGCDECFQQS